MKDELRVEWHEERLDSCMEGKSLIYAGMYFLKADADITE